MFPQREYPNREYGLRAQFRELTGLDVAATTAAGLPRAFLNREIPSPLVLLESLPLGRRSAGTLRRYVAQNGVSGRWTYGRLLSIPAFGFASLVDVLAAQQRRDLGKGGMVEPAAARPGLTREIESILSSRFQSVRSAPLARGATPALDEALAAISRWLPASEAEITRRLVDEGHADRPVSLGLIERAARFMKQAPPFAVIRRGGLVVAVRPEQVPLATRVYSLAMGAMTHWGLAPIRHVALQARAADVEFVAAVLKARQGFRWVNKRLRWFWFETKSNPLVRSVERVLSLGRPVRLNDLARSLFRRWPPDVIPPPIVLRDLLGQQPQFELEGSLVRLIVKPAEPDLTASDRQILALFRTWGPRIQGFRIPLVSDRLGLAAESIRRLLRSSALVIERQPGLFQLIGT